jgi:branched-chain amino acid transport system substrate-binding protein
MRKRRCADRALLIAGAIVFAGSFASALQAAEPYEINAILSLTGSGAFLGQGQQDALVIAEGVVTASGGIAGRPLKFIFRDDQSNPQIAVQLASEILAGNPAVILGSSLVASCRAIAPLVQNGPLLYCLSPGIHPDAGSYVFTSSASTHDQIDVVVRYFRLKGWKRIAFLVSTDATGQDAETGFKETLAQPENKDMQLVELAHFNTGDVSVAAQIEAIKAAHPQCVIAWATGTPIATTFRAMLDGGLDIPTATTGGNMTYRQMEQYAKFLPRQLYFGSTQWVAHDPAMLPPKTAPIHEEYIRVFAAAGKRPEVSSELAWDPAMIVVAALRARGANATAAELRDFIAHLKDHPGINGVYDFTKVPQRGLDVSGSLMAAWSPAAKTWQVVSEPRGIPLHP